MDHTLVFCEINMNHIPVVNSWYYDNTDSSYVEELTESFVMYVASNPNHYCWIVYQNNVPVGKVTYEIVEQKTYIDILIKPDYRRIENGISSIEIIISGSETS